MNDGSRRYWRYFISNKLQKIFFLQSHASSCNERDRIFKEIFERDSVLVPIPFGDVLSFIKPRAMTIPSTNSFITVVGG